MTRARHLIGLPVLGCSQMKRLGQVQEVLFSPDGSQICGLLLDAGWLKTARVLDYRAVRTVGDTHLLADEVYLDDHVQTRCRRDLQGLPVLRSDGEEAGIMEDVWFDPATGAVTALELSRGLVDDLLTGKTLVPLQAPAVTGEAAILLNGPVDLTGGTVS